MIELTKSEKRAAKDLIRKGILHRHVDNHNISPFYMLKQ